MNHHFVIAPINDTVSMIAGRAKLDSGTSRSVTRLEHRRELNDDHDNNQ